MDRITTQKQVDGPLAAKLHGLGQNLWIDVQSATSRQWLFIWKKDGRQRTKGLGSATGTKGAKIALAEARRRADRLRASIADGNDPVLEERKETTLFGDFADQVLKKLAPEFRHPKTMKNWKLHLDVHARPLRNKPIAAITSADIAAAMEPLRAKPETARQLRGRIETVLRHARTAGLRSGENPASREALSMPRRRKNSIRHHPAMPYETVPAFVASLDPTMNGHAALQLLILTATRTNEVAGAEWREFDLAGRLWTIPASRVKNGADHHVPLTDEMLALARHAAASGRRGAAVPGMPAAYHAGRAAGAARLRWLYRARLPLGLPRLVRQRDQLPARGGRGDLRPRGRQRGRTRLPATQGTGKAPQGAGGMERLCLRRQSAAVRTPGCVKEGKPRSTATGQAPVDRRIHPPPPVR